jgi:hypothetical protein
MTHRQRFLYEAAICRREAEFRLWVGKAQSDQWALTWDQARAWATRGGAGNLPCISALFLIAALIWARLQRDGWRG